MISRLWQAEDEVRDLTNLLEISRENIKVLKRGYTEKLEETQRQLKERNSEIESMKYDSEGNPIDSMFPCTIEYLF
jgi:hypothetical protein